MMAGVVAASSFFYFSVGTNNNIKNKQKSQYVNSQVLSQSNLELIANQLKTDNTKEKKLENNNSYNYIVQQGDNFWKLSQTFKIPHKKIIADNREHYKNPNIMHPNDIVLVKNPKQIPYNKLAYLKSIPSSKYIAKPNYSDKPKMTEIVSSIKKGDFRIYNSINELKQKHPKGYESVDKIAKSINADLIDVAAIVSHETGRTFSKEIEGKSYDSGLIQIIPSTARKYGITGNDKEISSKLKNMTYEAQTDLAINYLKDNIITKNPKLEDIACAIFRPIDCEKLANGTLKANSHSDNYIKHVQKEKSRLLKVAKEDSTLSELEKSNNLDYPKENKLKSQSEKSNHFEKELIKPIKSSEISIYERNALLFEDYTRDYTNSRIKDPVSKYAITGNLHDLVDINGAPDKTKFNEYTNSKIKQANIQNQMYQLAKSLKQELEKIENPLGGLDEILTVWQSRYFPEIDAITLKENKSKVIGLVVKQNLYEKNNQLDNIKVSSNF